MTNKATHIETASEGSNLDNPQGADFCLSSTIGGQRSSMSSDCQKGADFLKPSQTCLFDEDSSSSSSAELSKFFSLATVENSYHEWESSDLRAILSHQLSAPMVFDFCATIKSLVAAEETRTWTGERASIPRSFHDLFTHNSPSTKLLNLTKEFAKANWKHPDSPLPSEIAVVLYYTCIAVAFVRQGEWITKLSKGDAKCGLSWIQSQPWVDQSTKDICRQAVANLN